MLYVSQIAAGLFDLPVSWILSNWIPLKYWTIGLPEVADAPVLPVSLRNPAPEPGVDLGRAISVRTCYELSSPTTGLRPRATVSSTVVGRCPPLIEFKNIGLLGRSEPVGY